MPGAVNSALGQLPLSFTQERRIFGVNELNSTVQRFFEADFRNILVAGEISGCRIATSGHYYFSLKDEQSQVRCALFKTQARYSRCKPRDGVSVIARGSLEVYQARGEYQLIVESLEPQGAGALQLAFEQLKSKLATEGLFDSARKRPLPKLPRRIGIVTSPSGAVISDILNVLNRRFRGLHIQLFPAQVQGEGAVEQVCGGLHYFSRVAWPEVIILARGGGSLEDLWTFNEEAVARAIAGCSVPVLSAIGHETDFTIADFVADHRAPTPSAAAEIVICTSDSLLEQVASCKDRALQAMRYRLLVSSRNLHQRGTERAARLIQRLIMTAGQRRDEFDDRLRYAHRQLSERRAKRLRDLGARLQATNLQLRFSQSRHRSDLARQKLTKLAEARLWKARSQHELLALRLNQLSPLAVLGRGYAILEKVGGVIVREANSTVPGEHLKVRLHRGQLSVTVYEAKE